MVKICMKSVFFYSPASLADADIRSSRNLDYPPEAHICQTPDVKGVHEICALYPMSHYSGTTAEIVHLQVFVTSIDGVWFSLT